MGTAESLKEACSFGARAGTLAELFARAQVPSLSGSAPPISITSLVDDSRKVRPGSCFVAVRGTGADGHEYIEAAVRAGATAVVYDRDAATATGEAHRHSERSEESPVQYRPEALEMLRCAQHDTTSAVFVRVADSRAALAKLAAAYHGLRDARSGVAGAGAGLQLIGITGTNGKTTVAWLLRAILKTAGHKCALLGTVEYDLGSRRCSAPLTTPGALALCEHLAEARDAGTGFAVMEVSSHALDQRRCDGLSFGAGVFTNLTGDHLDYHGNMDAYFAAKRRLFENLRPPSIAVVNLEDPRATELMAACRTKVVTYAVSDPAADFSCQSLDMDRGGTSFDLVWRNATGLCGTKAAISASAGVQCSPLRMRLAGRHNVLNALAAAATALSLGIDESAVIPGLANVKGVPGRLERAEPSGWPFSVFVDYAHTDDALRNVLHAVRPITPGRVICVFGCGGNRDRTKRPRMAKVAEELADLVIVTSDNPRRENPSEIIGDILAGFADPSGVIVEADRRAAIAAAIAEAKPGDTVLIAGKGHEDYQLVGDQVLPFDDVAVAKECLAQHSARVMEEVA